jgi:hypothetical protein
MYAMLADSVSEFNRPMYSSITLGGSPPAGTVAGELINIGIWGLPLPEGLVRDGTTAVGHAIESERTNAAKDHQEERGGAGLLKWPEEVNYSPERTVLNPVIEER